MTPPVRPELSRREPKPDPQALLRAATERVRRAAIVRPDITGLQTPPVPQLDEQGHVTNFNEIFQWRIARAGRLGERERDDALRATLLDFAKNDLIPTSFAETGKALRAMLGGDRQRLLAAEGTFVPELLVSLLVIPGAFQAVRDVFMDVHDGDLGMLTVLSAASVIPLFGPAQRGARRAINKFQRIAAERAATRAARSPADVAAELRRVAEEGIRPRVLGHTPTVDDATYQMTMNTLASAWGSSNPNLLRQELGNVARIVRETPPEQLVRQATSRPQVVREAVSRTQRFRQAALRAVRAGRESNGATVNPRTGENVTSGYAVSPHKNREAVLDRRPTFEDVQKYMDDNADIFANENAHFGLWFDEDTGKWFMNVTEVRSDPWEAAMLGLRNGQKAMFHIDELEEIRLPEFARNVLPGIQRSPRRAERTREILNQFGSPEPFDPARVQAAEQRLRRQRRQFGEPLRPRRVPVNLVEESRRPVLYDDGTPTGRERVTWTDPDTPGLVIKGTVDGQNPTVLEDVLVDSRTVESPGGVGSLGFTKARAVREAFTSRGFDRIRGFRVGGAAAGPAADTSRSQSFDRMLSALAGFGATPTDEDGNELPFLGAFVAAVGGNPNASRVFRTGLSRPARRLYDALLADELELIHTAGSRAEGAQARNLESVARAAPSEEQLASAALAGHEGRGFYRRGTQAFNEMFGPEAPRFAALVAALSPQQPVQANLEQALDVWREWNKMPAEIRGDRRSLLAMINEVGRATPEGKMLGSRIDNALDVLMAPTPLDVIGSTLSGPKVNSFFRNFLGEMDRVTLDTWMARLPRHPVSLRGVTRRVGGREVGRAGGQYAGYSARIRNAARLLQERTGMPWTPADVQEAGWAWARSLDDTATGNRLQDDIARASPEAVRRLSSETGQIPELMGGRLLRNVREAGLAPPSLPAATPSLAGGAQPRLLDLEALARNILR